MGSFDDERARPGHGPLGANGSLREEDWTKVTVVLLNRQIVFLDRLSADIRAGSGAVVKRAEIIRALVDLLAERVPPVEDVRSADELKQAFRATMTAPANGV